MGVQNRKRRTFTPEFKAEAVRLVREQKLQVAQVARDLDLTPSALLSWVKQRAIDEGGGSGSGALTSVEREELSRLRKENRVLHEERDILKKATAFFAKHSK